MGDFHAGKTGDMQADDQGEGMTRRRFLGLSALGAAAALGSTSIGLAGCNPDPGAGPGFDPRIPTPVGNDATDFTAIVIGTGYGGAVSALRLGEAGVSTLVLEMGRLWNTPTRDGRIHCNMAKPDGRAMWFRDRTEAPLSTFLGLNVVNQNIDRYPGVLDRLNHENMSVYVGRGVGGGSLVNGGMAVVPPEANFREAFPDVDAAEMFSRYYPMATGKLRVGTIPEELLEKSDWYRWARVGRDQARNAGFKTQIVPTVYDYEYMKKEDRGEVHRSAFGNELMYGNNAGKNSLDKTYIADAIGTGKVTLRVLHRVDEISRDAAGGYTVLATEIGDAGPTGRTHRFTCRHLILSAGSMGTTEILVRARATGKLPALNDEVGRNWGNNGNVMTARANHVWNWTGTKQSTVPAIAINDWGHPTHPAFAEIAPLPMGFENWISLYLALTKTSERGHIEYDAASNRAVLRWGPNQSAHSIEATKLMFDKMNKANATVYRTDIFGGGRAFAGDFTYHPLGGCVLGKATDAYGKLKGYENLYVNDAALIPGILGVNPFVTITALAERNIERIIREDIPAGLKKA